MTARDDILGRDIVDVFPDNPDDARGTGVEKLSASLQRVLRGRKPDAMTVQKYDIRRPSGEFEVRYWSPVNFPVLNDAGELTHIVHRVEDVTEFVVATEAQARQSELADALRARGVEMEAEIFARARELQAANAELRSTADAIQDGLLVADSELRVVSVNRALCQMTGFTAAELVGEGPPYRFWAERESDRARRGHRDIDERSATHREVVLRRWDGRLIDATLSSAPVRDAARRGVAYVATDKDLSAPQAQARLERALRRVAATIAEGQDASTAYGRVRSEVSEITSFANGVIGCTPHAGECLEVTPDCCSDRASFQTHASAQMISGVSGRSSRSSAISPCIAALTETASTSASPAVGTHSANVAATARQDGGGGPGPPRRAPLEQRVLADRDAPPRGPDPEGKRLDTSGVHIQPDDDLRRPGALHAQVTVPG